MKKLLIIISVITYCSFPVFTQETVTKYVFPIYPGDKSWQETRYPERLDYLQIPDSALKTMSNIQLIGACFDYPFSINLFAYNNLEEGFINLCNIFNGYSELLARRNITTELIDFYKNMSAFNFSDKYATFNEYHNPLKFYLLETILIQDKIINKLDYLQKVSLISACEDKYHLKKDSLILYDGKPVFSSNSLRSTMKVVCSIALTDKNSLDPAIAQLCKRTLNNSTLSNENYDRIISELKKYYIIK